VVLISNKHSSIQGDFKFINWLSAELIIRYNFKIDYLPKLILVFLH